VALELGLETRGWVPQGRRAEDGVIDPRYPGLVETEEAETAVRTRRNVEESEALLVLTHGPTVGGTALALAEAARLGRPTLLLGLDADPAVARTFLAEHAAVNVAGPRESELPGAYEAARVLLRSALS